MSSVNSPGSIASPHFITIDSRGDTNSRSSALDRRIPSLLVTLAVYVVPPLSLTMPKTSHLPVNFDTADTAKLVALILLSTLAFFYLLNHWYQRTNWTVHWPIALMGSFASYGLLSVLWSPLPMVTIDKAGTLGVLCVIAMASCEVIRSRNDISKLLLHLSISLLMLNGFIAICYLYDPTMTGLDRLRIETGGDGIIHPTASGSTASLALLILLLSLRLWRFHWASRILLPAVLVHGLILVISNSRMSILMLGIASTPWLIDLLSVRRFAILASMTAAALMAIVVLDPGLIGIGIPAAELFDYVTRGQDTTELAAVSGRSEMWQAVWQQFLLSPWIGHGYFVTSRTGEMTVWYVTANHLSHNMILQSLATTGVLGTTIFVAALIATLWRTYQRWFLSRFQPVGSLDRCKSSMVLTMLLWYAGWSLLACSFIGPLRPESLIFFFILAVVCAKSEIVDGNGNPVAA